MNKLVKKIVSFSAIGAVLAGLSIGNAFAFMNQQVITATLCGTGDNLQTSSETLKLSDELCRKIGDESMVLLRNENNTLPLESKKVNVFGWGATDEGFLLKGKGSGSSSIPSHNDEEGKPIKKTLLTALKENDFEVNQEIIDIYDSFGRSTSAVRKNSNLDSGTYKLAEPKQSSFTDTVMQNAQDFSDTAIYVISRCGGENIGDMPINQNNTGRTYLQITP
ncbi:MAG: glycoside hydrolase family 3 C-terminal domain-containing protein, partial [Clostridia bacterium]|nr:glycoside hydrolase family 3 C-terminal domain-containing protein [Clostridia bacterium]